MKTFQDYLDENHLKPGTKLKKGDEELKVVKPVGDDKYLVKEEQVNLDESTKDYHTKMASAHEKAIASAKTSDLKSLHTRAMNLHKKAAEHGNKQTIDMANELSSKLKDGMSSLPSSMKPVSPSDYRRQGAVTHAYAKNEEVEIEEGIQAAWTSIMRDPWSKTVASNKGYASEMYVIAKGKDFEIWTGYNGSLNRQPHYVVRDDKVVGSGWTMPSALKDAGLKKTDVVHYSKYQDDHRLNTMKESVKALFKLTEAKHRVSVTVSDPNHTAVSKRKEQSQKTVRVSAESESDAVTKAKAFYKKQGYKVHDAAHAGMVHEEVEPIDELSKGLVHKYLNHADPSQGMRNAEKAEPGSLSDPSRHKQYKKKVKAGVVRALARLRKEEFADSEQLDELNKTTLSGYVAKASSSKVWHQDNAKYARQDQQDDIADEEEAKANKRKAGIKRAISKITKEAVEPIDELSKETHMSYATAAGDHAVRLAKAIKVRREQGKGSSQEVKDMESERDKRVAGLSRLAKRVAEAKEEKLPKDMTGAKCEKCKKDKYKERSQFDDMDGKVTCSCGHRVDRWKKYKN